MTSGPEAGYYADPSIPGYIRYWDGTQWVPGTSRPAPSEPPAAAQQAVAPQPVPAAQFQTVPAQAAHPATAPQPAAQQQPQPEPPVDAESLATMIVPSAYGNRGAYNQGWSGGGSPFAAVPGLRGQEEPAARAEAEEEVHVVELAPPGSRILARIIDLCIASAVSAPATVTLLLIAHRHDHAYVQQLRLQARTTYRALGVDTVGAGLWLAAVLVVIVTAVVFDVVRLSRSGQTPGRRLLGLMVVRADTAGRISGAAALTRSAVFWFCAVLPVLGLAALGGVLWGRPYRQGWHEKAGGSITIKA